MLRRARYIALVVIFTVATLLLPAKITNADVSPCVLSTTPLRAASNSQVDFQFDLTNGSGNATIRRVLITLPSSDFSIISVNSTGWDSSISDSYAEFFNNSLLSDTTTTFHMIVRTGNFIDGETDWGVYAFDGNDANGYGSLVCQNNSPFFMDDNTPHISNVNVNDVTATSVSLHWVTSLPANSKAEYGQDSGYGNTATNADFVTEHTLGLKGLNPNTAYHYRVSGATAQAISDVSSDGTFQTAIEQAQVVKTVNIPGLSVVVTNPSDKTPPVITLEALANQSVFKSAPLIKGTATDDTAIARVEFSINNGRDWLLTDTATGIGGKSVAFGFTAQGLEDGNYSVMARAIDSGGNSSSTTPFTIVIDRLPPIVGGSVVTLGPQVLTGDQNGVIHIMAGVDQKITLSAVGGPTTISLHAANPNSKETNKTFSLTQSADTGLWSGIVSFTSVGTYNLVASSVDGAGNKSVKNLNIMQVKTPAQVVKHDGKAAQALITAYYMVPETNEWVVWDGSAYSQNNPQRTDNNGNFKLFLPSGTYYLKATGKDISSIITNTFTLSSPTPIVAKLKSRGSSDLMQSFFSRYFSVPINANIMSTAHTTSSRNSLLGDQVPDLQLASTNGQTVHAVDLLGKPTILSFMSNWAPSTSDQLPALDQLSNTPDINVYPIALQESIGKMRAYQAITGYKVPWLADPDSTTSDSFKITSLPTHFFISREGTIKKIIIGVLSKSELLNNITGL